MKQEPVARIVEDCDIEWTMVHNLPVGTLLYTAPQTNIKFNQTLECPSYLSGLAPRELSDEEINEIAQQCWVYPQGEQGIFNQHKFARAILKKASEK